ncbi:MAG TPA: PepSY domain-containing protein [Terriglobales bacterium]|nr:PepSY domain-containing protein [Terriglobales bacterium]
MSARPTPVGEAAKAKKGTALVTLRPAERGEREPHAGRRRWVRRLHAVGGLVLTLNLTLLLVTGFLMQHTEGFGLDGKMVSRAWLPADYRPQDGSEVRADIVVTDLHSGRLLGGPGRMVVDAVSIGWLIMLVSGLVLYGQGRWRNGARNGNGEG